MYLQRLRHKSVLTAYTIIYSDFSTLIEIDLPSSRRNHSNREWKQITKNKINYTLYSLCNHLYIILFCFIESWSEKQHPRISINENENIKLHVGWKKKIDFRTGIPFFQNKWNFHFDDWDMSTWKIKVLI